MSLSLQARICPVYDEHRNTSRNPSARRLAGWALRGLVLATLADPRSATAQAPVGETRPAPGIPASPTPGPIGPARAPGIEGVPNVPPGQVAAPGTPLPELPAAPTAAPAAVDATGPKVINAAPAVVVPPAPVPAPAPIVNPPAPPLPAPTTPADVPPGTPLQEEFPVVVPVNPNQAPAFSRPGQKYIDLRRDTTGLLPDAPPGPFRQRPTNEVGADVDRLIERVLEHEAELALVVGQTKVFETRRALTRIAISNPAIADVEILNDQPSGRTINLYGRSFGTTTLTFWDADGKAVTFLVRVTLDTLDMESRLKQTFPGSAVHVRQVGPQVILEGQVTDAKTMSEVLQLVTADLRNSGGIRTQGGASGPNASSAAAGAAQGAAQGAAASGTPPAAAAAGAAQGATGGLMAQFTIINRVHVPGPRQVLLHVKIAELNRTAIRNLGISWLDGRNNALLGSTIGNAASIAATAGPITQSSATGARGALSRVGTTFTSNASATPNNAQLFGIFNAGQFSLFLNALRSNALAKLLAEPNLMTLDGQPARFLAGGLFPYPVPQSSSIPGGTAVVTVQFANFGAILSFLPHILANDVIHLDVEPVFSQLNFGAGTTINGGRVPAIDQRSARTVVELREGQTLAIAGLLQTTQNSTTTRIPFLGDLPIVGGAFSSNSVETVETELVVLVTPELVSPMEASEVPPSPGDRVTTPNDYEFFFLGRIEGKLGRQFRDTIAEHDPLDVMKHFTSENHWVIGPHGHAD